MATEASSIRDLVKGGRASDVIFMMNCSRHFQRNKSDEKYGWINENLLKKTEPKAIKQEALGHSGKKPIKLGSQQKVIDDFFDELATNRKVKREIEIVKTPNNESLGNGTANPLGQKSRGGSKEDNASAYKLEEVMILAVDATPTRVGGLLRLPGQERTILYYNVDWTSHFDFPQEPPKFEMANTVLALELFEPYIKAYMPRYKKLIVKTDSLFFDSMKGFKDPFDFACLQGVREKVKSLNGVFQHVVVAENDADIKNADYLSRVMIPVGLKAQYEDTNDYALIDLSKTVEVQTLDAIRDIVPGRFLKGYNSY